MKAVQTILLVVLAMAAVASAYEPIADNKLPSPKSPVKPEPTLSSRKLLQQQAAKTMSGNTMTNTDKPNVMWGGYVITPPYWVAGMGRDATRTSATANPVERRFASMGSK